jgi:hypothetical protein
MMDTEKLDSAVLVMKPPDAARDRKNPIKAN